MPVPCQRRLPLQPLMAAAHATSQLDLARQCRVHVRQVQRWLHEGVTERQADIVAVRLGLHPSAVWTDWFTEETRASA